MTSPAEEADLRQRLEAAEEALRAIRSGAIDALVVSTEKGDMVFRLEGSDDSYRVLLDSLPEGVAMLSHSGGILYANARFAEILHETVVELTGTSFQQRILPAYRSAFATGSFTGGHVMFAEVAGQQDQWIAISTAAATGTTYVVVSDASERKQTERGLIASQSALLERNRVLKQRIAELEDLRQKTPG